MLVKDLKRKTGHTVGVQYHHHRHCHHCYYVLFSEKYCIYMWFPRIFLQTLSQHSVLAYHCVLVWNCPVSIFISFSLWLLSEPSASPFSPFFSPLPFSPCFSFPPPLPSSYANKWPCHSSSLVGLEWMEVSFWKACSVWHSDRLRSRVLCTPFFSAQGSAYLVNDLQDCHWASSTPPAAEAAGLGPLEEADGGLGGVRWSCL